MRSVSFSPLVYITKPWKLSLGDPIWQITSNQNHLHGGHNVETGHHKMAVLGMASYHGDKPWKFRNHVIVWGTIIVWRSVKPFGNEIEWWISNCGVVFKLTWISILSRISDCSVHYRNYFSIRLGPLRWVPTTHCAGRRGLILLTAVRPVELANCEYSLYITKSDNSG